MQQVGCTGKIRELVTRSQSSQGTDFVEDRQQDTAEFLTSLMGCIQNELREEQTEDLKNLVNTSIVEELVCANPSCGETAVNMVDHPFSLPIQVSNSVEQSLKSMCSEELRARDCDTCGGRFAKVTPKVTSLPRILIMQILRFTSENGEQKKVTRDISVPIDLRPNADGPTYKLTGAMVHIGNTTDCGHFVSIINCPKTGKLYWCSDSDAPVEVTPDKLSQAYMLVYNQLDGDVGNQKATVGSKKTNQSDMGNDMITTSLEKECKSDNVVGNIKKRTEGRTSNIVDSNPEKLEYPANAKSAFNPSEASLIRKGVLKKDPNKKTLIVKLQLGRWQKIFKLSGGNPLKLLNNSRKVRNVCFANVVMQSLFSLG